MTKEGKGERKIVINVCQQQTNYRSTTHYNMTIHTWYEIIIH